MRLSGSWVLGGALMSAALFARGDLSQDQLKLLQNPGGWEYISVSDQDNGVQTQHTCFDGTPHADECSGKLLFSADGKFFQNVKVHHQAVQRSGRYELNGDEVAFFDELGTRDGPYTVSIDPQQKTMSLKMPQVQMRLMLESAYKRAMKQKPTGSAQ